MGNPIDYDSPRRPAVELNDDSLDELKTRATVRQSPQVDGDDVELAEAFDLPGTDLTDEEMTVAVIPIRADEFRCVRCFLVHHRSQLVIRQDGQAICQECA